MRGTPANWQLELAPAVDGENNVLTRALATVRHETGDSHAAEKPLFMDAEDFRAFYERTARPLWGYLARASGDPSLADDLLQECYCRFFCSTNPPRDEAHRRNYLFRIATNLLRDHWRREKKRPPAAAEIRDFPISDAAVDDFPLRSDLGRALAQMKPRERELLWLAYAEGASHKEIAEISRLRIGSIRPLLFRARKKLLGLLSKPRIGVKSSKVVP